MNELTIIEQSNLTDFENLIEGNLSAFYAVGKALLDIRERKLYRGSHGTFEAYCKERWDFSRRNAYYLIDAASVIENVNNCSQKPATESQARPLSKLEPDQQREAWQQAVDTAPDGKVTAAHVYKIVKGMTMGTPEVKEKVEDSDAVFQLKRWWKRATKKDKQNFLSWVEKGEGA